MLVQGENVVVVDGRCGWLEEKSSEMRTSTRKVAGVWRRVQGVFPSAVVVELRPKCLVGSFAQAVGGKVQWDG